jgi:hypothetical protein
VVVVLVTVVELELGVLLVVVLVLVVEDDVVAVVTLVVVVTPREFRITASCVK